jgi:hypothetical protein
MKGFVSQIRVYLRLSAANTAGYAVSIHDLRFTIHGSVVHSPLTQLNYPLTGEMLP